MTTKRTFLLVALTAWLIPQSTTSQIAPRVAFVPVAGWYAPQRAVGPAAPAASTWYLRLDRIEPTPFAGASLEITWPTSRIGARLIGFATIPSGASGIFDCYPGMACPAVFLASEADVTIVTALADLLLSPVQADAVVRPYAVLGGGLKYYRYAWPDVGAGIEAGKHNESTPALHAGLGLAFELLGGSFRTEVTDSWSRKGEVISPATLSSSVSGPRRNTQHDLVVSLGWRLAGC